MSLAAAALIAAASALAVRLRQSVLPVSGPIILISIDTLRADHVAAYGYRSVPTPAIDGLATDGILFERAYAHAPQTLPAHTSMLSGLLPFQHGVRDNVGFRVAAEGRLLPELLREHGFTTGGVASAYVLRRETGIGRGFDFYDAEMPPTSDGAGIDEAQRDGAASLAIAQRWMENRPSSRLFLFLHLYEPHAPYSPPARYGQYAAYDGEIAYADEIVARLIQWLRDRNWYDASTIYLVSDHGEGLSDHGELEHGLFLYEEAVRVPFIVKLPHQTHHGRRVKEIVQHVDLLPTILDLADLPAAPATLPGRSLRPLLDGRRDGWPERGVYSEALFGWYHFGWSDVFALTETRYRFIRAPRAELYNLQNDVQERHNLAAERVQSRTAMERALDAVRQRASPEPPEAATPEVRERLAALGYVGTHTGAAPAAGTALPDPKDKVQVLLSYRRALELDATGQLAAAVDVLKQLARAEPAMAHVWQRMARLLVRLGRTEEAVDAYRQSIRLTPTSVSGFIGMSTTLLKLGRLDEARMYGELAAQVAAASETRDQAAAYELLAKIALARSEGTAARRFAALAQQADPSFPLPDYVEGRLAYGAGDYQAAWSHFRKALDANRLRTIQIPDLHLYAGDTLAHLERFDEAEHEFREEIRFFPANTWAYLSLANLYKTFGRSAQADRVLTAMVRAVPSPEAVAQAARLRGGSRSREDGRR